MDEDQATEPQDDATSDVAPGGTDEATAEPTAPATVRIHLIGALPASADRVRQAGAELVDDPAEAELVVVSTRVPADDLPTPLPAGAVALVHPGGDARAVALLAAGARGLRHEGDEAALLSDAPDGLPTREERGTTGGDTVAVLRLRRSTNLESRNVTSLVHRRLLTRWRAIVGAVGAELRESDDTTRMSLVWPGATATDVRTLSVVLASAAEAFVPDGAAPLGFAAGVALPGDAPDATSRLQLASDAADLALSRGAACLTAEEALSASVGARAAATLASAAKAAERILGSPGHGDRCVALAQDVARHLGLSPAETADLVSAARFHHVGLLAAGEGATCTEETRHGAVALARPHLGDGVARALTGEVVAACDVVDASRETGTTEPDRVLAAVEAALPDLAEEVRDALRASLGSGVAPGQAVPA